MKCGARVAIGVAAGYFLGRTKKMKLALMLGGMAAGRRAGGPAELLGRGAKLLESSPELSALRDQVQGRLMDAGKGAVLSVATRQIESLTDKVAQRLQPRAPAGVRDVRDRVAERVTPTDDDVDDEAARAEDEEPDAPSRPGSGDEERDEGEREPSADSGSASRSESPGRSASGRATAGGRRAVGGVSKAARSGARAGTDRPRRPTRGER